MPSHRLTDEKRRQLVELAKGWGKIAAENAYGPQGPGLDVDLAGLETIAVELQQALLSGFCEVSTQQQAERLPETLPCPSCGQECSAEPAGEAEASRSMKLRGGAFDLAEPRYRCASCRRSFFPSAERSAD